MLASNGTLKSLDTKKKLGYMGTIEASTKSLQSCRYSLIDQISKPQMVNAQCAVFNVQFKWEKEINKSSNMFTLRHFLAHFNCAKQNFLSQTKISRIRETLNLSTYSYSCINTKTDKNWQIFFLQIKKKSFCFRLGVSKIPSFPVYELQSFWFSEFWVLSTSVLATDH